MIVDGEGPISGALGAFDRAEKTSRPAPLSEEDRRRFERLAEHDDPAVRRWAKARLAAADVAALKSTRSKASGLREYVAALASSDPDPAVRARADAVLERLDAEATT